MNIVLIEDNPIQSQALKTSIQRWEASASNNNVFLRAFDSAESFLSAMSDISAIHGFFLDLYLPKMNGIDLAKIIRSKSAQVPIIFVSNSGYYLKEGYEVQAYRYLIKPVPQEDINHCLNYIAKHQMDHDHNVFCVRVQGEEKVFHLSDVIMISLDAHRVLIKTREGTYGTPLRTKFAEFLKSLPNNHFIRCHQSFFVNPLYIRSFTMNSIVLDDKEIIPISRSFRKKARSELQCYFLGGLFNE